MASDRERILALARVRHDKRCRCDRKCLMSCGEMAAAILAVGYYEGLKEPPPAAHSQPTPAPDGAVVRGEADAATGAQTGAEADPWHRLSVGLDKRGIAPWTAGTAAHVTAALAEIDRLRMRVVSGELAETLPRTWTLPAEPGVEVTAVRATELVYGFTLWRRISAKDWQLTRNDGVGLTIAGWPFLLGLGPLTDASGEAAS